jgi:hypothetical protein
MTRCQCHVLRRYRSITAWICPCVSAGSDGVSGSTDGSSLGVPSAAATAAPASRQAHASRMSKNEYRIDKPPRVRAAS